MKSLLIFQADVVAYHLYYIQEGILKYFEQGEHALSFVPLQAEEVDLMEAPCGAVGVLTRDDSIGFLRRKKIPYLDLNESITNRELGFDIAFSGEGTLAADHFVHEAGVRSLAFVGASYSRAHLRRLAEFESRAAQHGFPVHPYMFKLPPAIGELKKREDHNDRHRAKVHQFLEELEKPVGIFCGNDRVALHHFYLARSLGYHVPTEISLLGVGSLQRSIGGWPEQVSVIQLDHHQLGYSAAALMEKYMTTGRPPDSVRLKTDGIIHRQTTVRSVRSDQLVRQAMEFIRKTPGTTPQSLCAHFSVPRHVLEARFQRALGGSIAKLIDQERFNQARDLLKNFKYNLESVAALAGYADRRHLRRGFYKHARMSPSDYRSLNRTARS